MKTMPFFTRENSKGAYYKIYNTVKGSIFRVTLVPFGIFKGDVMKIILIIYLFLKKYLF